MDPAHVLASIRPLVIDVDGLGVVRGAYGGFGGFLGLDIASIAGQSVFDHVSPTDAEELATYFLDSAGESYETVSLPVPFRIDLIGADGRLHPVDVIAAGRDEGGDTWGWVATLVPVALQASISRPVDALINREPRERVKSLLTEELAVDNLHYLTRAFLAEPVEPDRVAVVTSRAEDQDVCDEIARQIGRGWTPWAGVGPDDTVAIEAGTLPGGLRSLAAGRGWRRVSVTPVHLDGHVVGAYIVLGRVPATYATDRILSNIATRYRYIARVTALILRGWRARDRLEHAATHDPLTDLANRRSFDAAVADATAGGLLFVDVDDFKSVNDDHGHAVGDEVLIEIARRLAAACGPDDLAARIGGDEFAILAGPTTDVEQLVESVQRAVAAPLDLEQGPAGITVSVGWVTDVASGDSFAEAGRAMSRAKRQARAMR